MKTVNLIIELASIYVFIEYIIFRYRSAVILWTGPKCATAWHRFHTVCRLVSVCFLHQSKLLLITCFKHGILTSISARQKQSFGYSELTTSGVWVSNQTSTVSHCKNNWKVVTQINDKIDKYALTVKQTAWTFVT